MTANKEQAASGGVMEAGEELAVAVSLLVEHGRGRIDKGLIANQERRLEKWHAALASRNGGGG